MSLPNLLNYIGVFTGIAGAIMGYLGLRRSDQFKSLDLRLELKRIRGGLLAGVNSLREFLDHAMKSHTRAAAAAGMVNSGATKSWLDDWKKDVVLVEALKADVIASQIDLSKFNPNQLEDQLVAASELQRQYKSIKSKYEASLASDDVRREHIRENNMFTTQARLGKKE